MKYIRRFNESLKEIDYDESHRTMMILNLIPRGGNYTDKLNELGDTIKDSLTKETFDKMFGDYLDLVRDSYHVFNFFITQVINKDDLLRMFDKVQIQEGSDDEDEWVATLSINNKIVQLLASPERGNSIRVEGRDSLPMEELKAILIELCKIYNERF